MTSQQLRIPDAETAKRTIEKVRQARLAFEEVDRQLDEINSILQQNLEKQWSKSWSKRRQSVGLE